MIVGQVSAVEYDSKTTRTPSHEIGHNFGLEHTEKGSDNLMSPGGTSTRLTEKQRKQMFAMFTGLKDGSMHFGQRVAQKMVKRF
jgi:hypothetical protein